VPGSAGHDRAARSILIAQQNDLRDRGDLDTASSAGQAFTAAIWLPQAVVWALATLVIAGYTGLIRKVA
jgi:hypothetical protein